MTTDPCAKCSTLFQRLTHLAAELQHVIYAKDEAQHEVRVLKACMRAMMTDALHGDLEMMMARARGVGHGAD